MYQCTVLYSVHCTKSKLMIFTFLLCAYNSTVYNIRTAIFLMRKETISEQLLPPLIVFFVVYFLYFCCWQRLASWCRVPWNWNTFKIFSIIYYFFILFFYSLLAEACLVMLGTLEYLDCVGLPHLPTIQITPSTIR